MSTDQELLPVRLTNDDRLVCDMAFCISLQFNGTGLLIAIPKGYSWDGASIPKICWSIMGHPLEADLRMASLVHDWNCEHATNEAERMVGDALFLMMLQRAGLKRWRRIAMWLVVRFYAIFIWKPKRHEEHTTLSI